VTAEASVYPKLPAEITQARSPSSFSGELTIGKGPHAGLSVIAAASARGRPSRSVAK
jgi:hypothetical protein